jgi:tRNA (cytidine/uridine-2'-O-)-methyltransferase
MFKGVKLLCKAIELTLVHPEIPANTGNIMRLSAAADIPLHLIEPLGFVLQHKELRRAGMDYRNRCSFFTHLTFEDLEQENPGRRFLFFSARSERSFFGTRVLPGDFMVLGPESKGLSKEFLKKNHRIERTYQIPMPGGGRSLNLATAAGIIVYESLRQLGLLGPRNLPCPPSA